MMRDNGQHLVRRVGMVLALPIWLMAGATQPARAAEGPFGGLSGEWSGSGTIAVSNGTSERIRCRANYSVTPSGEQLHQELRCASDSYKFEVTSNVIASEGGSLSGTWTETTRQVTGAVSGKAGPGSISTSVKGPAFSATLSVQTKGDRQAVTIRPTSGSTEISAISIELRRG